MLLGIPATSDDHGWIGAVNRGLNPWRGATLLSPNLPPPDFVNSLPVNFPTGNGNGASADRVSTRQNFSSSEWPSSPMPPGIAN
jgi:hypothetical protein